MLASNEREQIIWIYGHRKKRILNDPWKHDLIRAYSDTAVYNPFNVPMGYASGATLVQKFHKLVVSRWLPPTDKVSIAGKGYLGKNNPLERETFTNKSSKFYRMDKQQNYNFYRCRKFRCLEKSEIPAQIDWNFFWTKSIRLHWKLRI